MAGNIPAIVAIVAAVVAFVIIGFVAGSYVQRVAQLAAPANVQVTYAVPANIDVSPAYASMDVGMVVHNYGGTTATLESINYSLYANGNYVGSGQQAAINQGIQPHFGRAMTLPVDMTWGPAWPSVSSVMLNGGQLTLEVMGTCIVKVNGSVHSVPFDASITMQVSVSGAASTSTATYA